MESCREVRSVGIARASLIRWLSGDERYIRRARSTAQRRVDRQRRVTPALLEIRGLSKSFPGVQALVGVDLDVRGGEVHAVIGENGAGKSTLMKIVAGVYLPDAGSVRLAGKSIVNDSPRQALERGISMIHQELNLAPNLSVAENIFLGHAPTRGGLIDWRRLYADAEALSARLGIELDVRARVEDLSVARQQMVEIAKALSLDARVLIMDEPTSALTERETESLFEIIRRLKSQGVAVVYISHRLDEIFRITDRVTVLRDGRLVGSLLVADATQAQLIRMMVGRELTTLFPKQSVEIGEPVLEVHHLRRAGELEDISFVLRRREILGLAGLVGAGRTELVRVLFGADRLDSGEILVEGRPVHIRSPRDAIRLGLGFVTEDRKLQGLVLGMTVRENETLASLARLARLGFLDLRSPEFDFGQPAVGAPEQHPGARSARERNCAAQRRRTGLRIAEACLG